MSYSNHSGSRLQIPANFRLQYSSEEIAARVKSIGEEISVWAQGVWAESHTDVLAVTVLRGGLFFFSDLVRAISGSVEVETLRAIGYQPGVNEQQKASVDIYASHLAVKGRVVLIIDDICDSGRTLEALEKHLTERGAREVRTAVLIRRLLDRPTFVPCWVGFEFTGPEWFVGYGMEDSDRWRNLPAVYTIQQQGG